MWRRHAHMQTPLTKLCSPKVKFKWTKVENNTFISMKKILGHDVLLYYPNFSENFVMHTDASNTQLGGIMSQNLKLIVFYSRKLTTSKIILYDNRKISVKYSGNPKKFCTIILGHHIAVYTDLKNLTFEKITTERVPHCYLM